jgi:hypothetical protein
MRIGYAGHGIGDTRSGGYQRNAQSAGQLGLGMRHINSGAFVPHINDAYAVGVQGHPDGHDVAAAQAVNPLYALAFDEAGNQIGDFQIVTGGGVGTHFQVSCFGLSGFAALAVRDNTE